MDSTNGAPSESERMFRAGDLQGAIAAATQETRSDPSNPRARSRLREFLCFAGLWDRADAQLDAAAALAPASAAGLSTLRQLVRADLARQQFYQQGRAPEFLAAPPEHVKLCLAASIELREDRLTAAAELLAQADALRTPLPCNVDGVQVDDLRDLDDLLGGVLEILTPTGKYYWLPAESVESVQFTTPASLLDLLWRPAQLTVRGGPDAIVYMPCLYANSFTSEDPMVRIGRSTDWQAHGQAAAPVVRGAGLRMFLVGEKERDLLSLKSIETMHASS